MAVYRPGLKGGGLFIKPGEAPVPVEQVENYSQSLEETREKIASVYKRLKFPQRSLNDYRADYETSVVHDYGDEYHWTEAQKKAANEHYEMFERYYKGLRKIRKIPEYIRKYREYLNIVKVIAKDNGVYEPEEFLKMFAKGEIVIYGLNPPVLTGFKRLRKRKHINFNELAQFIASDEDPDDFFGKESEDEMDFDPGDLSNASRILTPDEIKYVREYSEDEATKKYFERMRFISNDEIKPGMPIAMVSDRKKLFKSIPELKQILTAVQRSADKANNIFSSYGNFGFSLGSELEQIAMYETKRRGNDEPPKFKGSIFDDKAFEDWVEKADEWRENHTYVDVGGSKLTVLESENLWMRDMLEQNGYNVRKLPMVIEAQQKETERIKALDSKFAGIRDRLLKSGMEMDSPKSVRKMVKKSAKVNKYAKGKQSFATFETAKIAEQLNEGMKEFEKKKKKGIRKTSAANVNARHESAFKFEASDFGEFDEGDEQF